MEVYSSTSSRLHDTSHLEHKREFPEFKGNGSVVDQRGVCPFLLADRSSTEEYSDEGVLIGSRQFEYVPHRQASYHGKSGRGKIFEDKGWLAAAMILGLLASYPLVIKPLHQVSTDMLSKMRGNLKTGAI